MIINKIRYIEYIGARIGWGTSSSRTIENWSRRKASRRRRSKLSIGNSGSDNIHPVAAPSPGQVDLGRVSGTADRQRPDREPRLEARKVPGIVLTNASRCFGDQHRVFTGNIAYLRIPAPISSTMDYIKELCCIFALFLRENLNNSAGGVIFSKVITSALYSSHDRTS
ncbi:hypothetical protein BR93DRAFT_214070 [Coniochaeta sp. PMI_546]|nr:hypothetical protein BR93DRAFT_214070 [Coniochaeta sp. PMI_546]